MRGVTVLPPEVALNVAFTVVLEFSVNAQEPVPEHVPLDQPAKVLPASAVATRFTVVPGCSVSMHVEPQLSCPPIRVTVPLPVPIFATESVPSGV